MHNVESGVATLCMTNGYMVSVESALLLFKEPDSRSYRGGGTQNSNEGSPTPPPPPSWIHHTCITTSFAACYIDNQLFRGKRQGYYYAHSL